MITITPRRSFICFKRVFICFFANINHFIHTHKKPKEIFDYIKYLIIFECFSLIFCFKLTHLLKLNSSVTNLLFFLNSHYLVSYFLCCSLTLLTFSFTLSYFSFSLIIAFLHDLFPCQSMLEILKVQCY